MFSRLGLFQFVVSINIRVHQFSWIRTVSRTALALQIKDVTSSYFDVHLQILWPTNDDKTIVAGVECKKEKQSLVLENL